MIRRPPARRGVAIGVVVVAALTASLVVWMSSRSDTPDPPSTTAPTTPGNPVTTGGSGRPSTTGSEPMTVPQLDWQSCDSAFECATMSAPLDYANPTGPTTEVAMVRQPASDPNRRIGALFMNPGGPGGSAVDLVEGLAGSLPRAVKERFDIVGVDPRGVGRSSPLHCEDHVPAMYGADPTIEDSQDRRDLLATSRQFVDDCKARYADLLPHVGTPEVARDMDLVRSALGDSQLSYFGYSYGTALGQVYAELFPSRVRAMVLDGVVDLSRPGVQSAKLQAEGFEQALKVFAADCRGKSGCPLRDDPIAVINRVEAAAERSPIPAPDADRAAGPGEINLALVQALYSKNRWPALAQAFAEADRPRPDGSRLVGLAESYLNASLLAPYFAVSCIDARWPTPNTLMADAKRIALAAPHFGEAITNDYIRCSLWPAKAQPIAAPTRTSVASVAPIVVVSTTGDPATPYESGVKVAGVFPRAALITHVGDTHTAALKGDECIDGPVIAYLLSLTLPPADLRCS